MIRDCAPAYCREKLFAVVFEAKRHEHFDQQMMSEMGALGFRCATIAGYGCAVVNYVSYGLIAREIERVDSGYRSGAASCTLDDFGTEAQRRHHLAKLFSGNGSAALA